MMPREHKRRFGSNRYMDYEESKVDEAVDAVRTGNMSQRVAAVEFNIPRTTLKRRLNEGKPKNKPGRPPVLTEEVEAVLLQRIELMCTWGFPLDGEDLRYLVKAYLDKNDIEECRFKKNMPSPEFVYHFKRRQFRQLGRGVKRYAA